MVVVDMDHTRVQVFIKINLYRETLAVGHLEGGVVSSQSSWGQWVDVTIALRGHLLDKLERTSRVLGWMFIIA